MNDRGMCKLIRKIPKTACKRTYQLPTLLRQQCWELLRACWQWCANGCNNSQQCWDLQCIVGRIQPMSLCKPCVMSVRGPNNVGRAVQTDPTLLRYASAITEQKKCWELLSEKFDRFQTLRNNTQQHPRTCNRVYSRGLLHFQHHCKGILQLPLYRYRVVWRLQDRTLEDTKKGEFIYQLSK